MEDKVKLELTYDELCYLQSMLLEELEEQTNRLENVTKANFPTEIIEGNLNTINSLLKKIDEKMY